MDLTESQTADYIDYCINEKEEKHCFSPEQKDTMKHIKGYFRMLQLQLNHIKAKYDMAYYFFRLLLSEFPKEKQERLLMELNKLKAEDDKKLFEELEEFKKAIAKEDKTNK